mmetsp:Transcript_9298/g.23980  ORF Transcript_9298/g.23980 Transcript_9298/m.23980 type:complete len:201 (-) Transcript_9298:226-828(-)
MGPSNCSPGGASRAPAARPTGISQGQFGRSLGPWPMETIRSSGSGFRSTRSSSRGVRRCRMGDMAPPRLACRCSEVSDIRGGGSLASIQPADTSLDAWSRGRSLAPAGAVAEGAPRRRGTAKAVFGLPPPPKPAPTSNASRPDCGRPPVPTPLPARGSGATMDGRDIVGIVGSLSHPPHLATRRLPSVPVEGPPRGSLLD